MREVFEVNRRIFLLSLFIALSASLGNAAEVTNLTKVALAGDLAPDTPGLPFSLSTPQIPLLNSSNDVAFIASVTDGPGYWAGSPLALAARAATDAPGTTSAQFNSFLGLAYGDNGHVHFQATLDGPQVGLTNRQGYWSGLPGAVELLVRTRDPATNAGSGIYFSELPGFVPQINKHGFSLWSAKLAGTGVTVNNTDSLWMGRPGDLHLVARQGDQAPGFDLGVTFNSIASENASLNDSNQVAFLGFTSEIGAFGFRSALWAGPLGELETVARTVDPAPGIPGAQFLGFTPAALDDTGRTAFLGTWINLGTSAAGVGLWVGRPRDLNLVAQSGDPLPGTDLHLQTFTGVLLNSSGQLAMNASVTNTAGTRFNGLWAGTPDDLILVALEGEVAPGMSDDFTITSLPPSFQLQDNGFIAFAAEVAGPDVTADNDRGFWWGTIDEPQLLLREGDTVELGGGSPAIIKSFSGQLTSNRPGTMMLNEHGNVALWLDFTQPGVAGIFVTRKESGAQLSLIPMPSGLQLSWTGEGFVLEQAESLDGPWSPSTDQSNPQLIPPTATQTYYRLSSSE